MWSRITLAVLASLTKATLRIGLGITSRVKTQRARLHDCCAAGSVAPQGRLLPPSRALPADPSAEHSSPNHGFQSVALYAGAVRLGGGAIP